VAVKTIKIFLYHFSCGILPGRESSLLKAGLSIFGQEFKNFAPSRHLSLNASLKVSLIISLKASSIFDVSPDNLR